MRKVTRLKDLPILKQMELRAILERNKPKTRIKSKQQSQLKKISKNIFVADDGLKLIID